MNIRQYIDLYGWPAAEKVAIKAGTNRAYFAQLASGHRKASAAKALAIVKASRNEIDFMSIINTVPKTRQKTK